jgi:DNA helicase-2/ATP-dependent DNA helicase PcrA
MTATQDFLADLNPRQRQAVTFGNGPLLVVAGAGSGKTKTLATRVAYLISNGTPPEKILLLTFTRRAAREMISRAAAVLGRGSSLTSQVWGGTFHAIANRLLRIYGSALTLSPDFTILDQSDGEDMMDVIRHKRIDAKNKGRFPRKSTLFAIYSRRMNSGEPLSDILTSLFPWCLRWEKEIKLVYKEYVALKQKRNMLDYDDLLIYWSHLLDVPAAAKACGAMFAHIVVDEYQDTNRIQSDILIKMRAVNNNIMAVGDDAQSIYSFRAATVRNMLDFPTLFPSAVVVTLEQNYRSSSQILGTTNRLIAQARNRYSKTLFSTRPAGGIPRFVTCKDEESEARYVVSRVLEHLDQGVALRNQAVLFRAGTHSAALEIELMKKDIPFHKYGGLKFLEAAHVKDFVSFVRILENVRDEMAWYRVLNLFQGVGPATAAIVFERLASGQFDLTALNDPGVPAPADRHVKALCAVLSGIMRDKNLLPPSQMERLAAFYVPLIEENYENPRPRCADIEHIVQLASGYASRTQFLSDIVLDPPASTSDLAGPALRDEDYLILSTIHSAKGCEWDAVYLIHAADGCLPSDMSTDNADDIEEELRLAYVAMTRARDFLYVSWPLRFYTHPIGHSDRHVYAQSCRFFTRDVLETMEQVTFGDETASAAPEIQGPAVDIRNTLKEMWD